MMFLKRFWKGDVLPGEGRYYPYPEYLKVIQTMECCEDKLKSRLSDEDFQTFREFADAALSSTCMESCDNFCDTTILRIRSFITESVKSVSVIMLNSITYTQKPVAVPPLWSNSLKAGSPPFHAQLP